MGQNIRFTGQKIRFTLFHRPKEFVSLCFIDSKIRFTGPEIRFTGLRIRFTGPRIRFTSPEIRFTSPKIRFTNSKGPALQDNCLLQF
jgi:hypothetical protein